VVASDPPRYTHPRGRAARGTPARGLRLLDYFTTTFFHHPDELRAEVAEAGFTVAALLGVEGPGWALPDLATRWAEPARRAEILAAARAIESEPSLLGFHAHVLAVGRAETSSA
jgi:sugar phosphate isomerase/epimerase